MKYEWRGVRRRCQGLNFQKGNRMITCPDLFMKSALEGSGGPLNVYGARRGSGPGNTFEPVPFFKGQLAAVVSVVVSQDRDANVGGSA
jgi:hypothetical protein